MSNPRHSFRRLFRTTAVLTILLSIVFLGSTALTATTSTTNTALFSPPPNDNFANAQPILGRSGIILGSNIDATKETGEANHANVSGGASVWYKWQAPENGRF